MESVLIWENLHRSLIYIENGVIWGALKGIVFYDCHLENCQWLNSGSQRHKQKLAYKWGQIKIMFLCELLLEILRGIFLQEYCFLSPVCHSDIRSLTTLKSIYKMAVWSISLIYRPDFLWKMSCKALQRHVKTWFTQSWNLISCFFGTGSAGVSQSWWCCPFLLTDESLSCSHSSPRTEELWRLTLCAPAQVGGWRGGAGIQLRAQADRGGSAAALLRQLPQHVTVYPVRPKEASMGSSRASALIDTRARGEIGHFDLQ